MGSLERSHMRVYMNTLDSLSYSMHLSAFLGPDWQSQGIGLFSLSPDILVALEWLALKKHDHKR